MGRGIIKVKGVDSRVNYRRRAVGACWALTQTTQVKKLHSEVKNEKKYIKNM
jgi:hypothetical protein